MKAILFSNFLFLFFFVSSAAAQDTSQNQTLSKDQTYPVSSPIRNYNNGQKKHIYRDTRLGSSSSRYNTYKKNDYGAGAITTNPHKTGSNPVFDNQFNSVSKDTNKIYRDTRLGSSSAPNDNYKKNDYGAGAVTTDPHK